MINNIYSEYVEVSKELDSTIKKCFVNHLVLYNYALGLLYDSEDITYNTIKKKVAVYIEEKNLFPVLVIPLFNELYYQFKKFKRNIKVQKKITSVQYFTYISRDYTSKYINIDTVNNEITFNEFEGKIILTKPLPEIEPNSQVYINISFSNAENKYKLSIHKFRDTE